MKILYLSDDFPPRSFGGAGIVAFRLAKAVHNEGHEVHVITVVNGVNDERVYEYDGLVVHALCAKYHERWMAYLSLYNPQTVGKVQKIITDWKPDVVHAHNIHRYISYESLRIAKKSGAKVFLTAHDVMSFHYGKLFEFIDPNNLLKPGSFNYRISPWKQLRAYKRRYNPFRNIVIRWYLRYVDTLFAVSYALKDALVQNGIRNVEVIHNGIDVGEWSIGEEKNDAFKEQYNLLGKKVILFGGRISEAKGGFQAIDILEQVVKEVPEAVLLIMGNENHFTDKITEKATKLGIKEHVMFTGWISGDVLKAAYASADVVLVPSIYLDPFPTINLEAMALKKPVVATCFGGSSEVVADGETGYIVNPFDVGETGQHIVSLLVDTKVAKLFSSSGYQKVLNEFSLRNQVQKVLKCYNQINLKSNE